MNEAIASSNSKLLNPATCKDVLEMATSCPYSEALALSFMIKSIFYQRLKFQNTRFPQLSFQLRNGQLFQYWQCLSFCLPESFACKKSFLTHTEKCYGRPRIGFRKLHQQGWSLVCIWKFEFLVCNFLNWWGYLTILVLSV